MLLVPLLLMLLPDHEWRCCQGCALTWQLVFAGAAG